MHAETIPIVFIFHPRRCCCLKNGFVLMKWLCHVIKLFGIKAVRKSHFKNYLKRPQFFTGIWKIGKSQVRFSLQTLLRCLIRVFASTCILALPFPILCPCACCKVLKDRSSSSVLSSSGFSEPCQSPDWTLRYFGHLGASCSVRHRDAAGREGARAGAAARLRTALWRSPWARRCGGARSRPCRPLLKI